MNDEPFSWERLEELLENIRERLEQIEDRLERHNDTPIHPYDSDIDDD